MFFKAGFTKSLLIEPPDITEWLAVSTSNLSYRWVCTATFSYQHCPYLVMIYTMVRLVFQFTFLWLQGFSTSIHKAKDSDIWHQTPTPHGWHLGTRLFYSQVETQSCAVAWQKISIPLSQRFLPACGLFPKSGSDIKNKIMKECWQQRKHFWNIQ